MAASVFDSPLYSKLFPTSEVGRLFTDSAALRAMLLVEGALAKAQGTLGMIPETSAAAIQRASLEIQIDPGALAVSTGENGVCVPGLVSAFRAEMNAPEHAQYVHWGATSQDIIDTGLMLRLRQALLLIEEDLRHLLRLMAAQAEDHAETPMAARTYSQHATVTTWGAVIASWGMPLVEALKSLPDLRAQNLWVSLSGAAGTASALGDDPSHLRRALAEGLGLNDPERSWHTDRGPILRIANWMQMVSSTLSAMAQTLIALSSSDIGEVNLGQGGASSTMPQKQNPVAVSAIAALASQTRGMTDTLHASSAHQHQRDGAAWFGEWMFIPQIVLATASAITQAQAVAAHMRPDTARMKMTLEAGLGTVHAEALSFALSTQMPRPEAQRVIKEMVASAQASHTQLRDIARAAHPDLPTSLFDHHTQAGQAPADARRFVALWRTL